VAYRPGNLFKRNSPKSIVETAQRKQQAKDQLKFAHVQI